MSGNFEYLLLFKDMTYEQAIKRLEEIVTGLESGTLELEKFTEYMAEAEKLNAFCEGVLNQLQEKIDSNETVNGKE